MIDLIRCGINSKKMLAGNSGPARNLAYTALDYQQQSLGWFRFINSEQFEDL